MLIYRGAWACPSLFTIGSYISSELKRPLTIFPSNPYTFSRKEPRSQATVLKQQSCLLYQALLAVMALVFTGMV